MLSCCVSDNGFTLAYKLKVTIVEYLLKVNVGVKLLFSLNWLRHWKFWIVIIKIQAAGALTTLYLPFFDKALNPCKLITHGIFFHWKDIITCSSAEVLNAVIHDKIVLTTLQLHEIFY